MAKIPDDTRAPRVVLTEGHSDTPDTTGPYVVRAEILDDMTSDRNFFDKGVFLNYSVDGGPTAQVPMRHSGGQVYRGEIPGQPACSNVVYFATALDFANNLGTGITRSFAVELAEDITGDGAVNVLDLIELLLCFGLPASPPCDVADLNGDGTVNVLDLIDMLLVFGASCP